MAENETEDKCVFTFLWRIENFSRSEVREDSIQSPSFSVRGLESKWRLEIDPMGLKSEDHCFCVRLVRIDISSDPLLQPIDCEMSFLGPEDVPHVIRTAQNPDFVNAETLLFGIDRTFFDDNKSTFLPFDTLSVRCRMWKSIGNFERDGHCSARNVFPTERLSIVWPIEGFTFLEINEIKSHSIEFDSVLYASGTLNFSLMGSSLSRAILNFDINALNTHVPLFIICEITILDRTGNKVSKCAEVKKKIHKSKVEQSLVLSQVMTRQDVLQSPYLEEDTLNLLCEFTFLTGEYNGVIESTLYGTVNENVPRHYIPHVSIPSCPNSQLSVDHPGISQEKNDSVSILQEDLLSLYKEQAFSDFELRSGGVSFPVHKNVLSVRSPVFRAMFSNMNESDSNFLDIMDVDAHTLNRMLTFLYAGTVGDLEWDKTLKLYYAAYKYQVESLMQKCASLLLSGIGVSNVCDILALVQRHQTMN